jgi:thymidylate synthase (FAD)
MTRRPSSPGAEELLGLYFPVLDHGFVALVDYMGTDECIERAARTSYGGGGRRDPSATRQLLRYLRRHGHTTPSEMLTIKVHCCMPIFVARQWIRHRTASTNEQSGRYTILPTVFYTPNREQLQPQSASNNQGREGDAAPAQLYDEATRRWDCGRLAASDTYEWMTDQGFARELARIDLPLSTYTEWYWKIDLHNLLHFLKLRVDSHAQWEIQQYGRVMAGMLKRIAPLSFEAWIDYDVCGARFSRMELDVLRYLVGCCRLGDGAVFPRRDARTLGGDDLRAAGLSAREVTELWDKIDPPPAPEFPLDRTAINPTPPPDFPLDLSQALTPEQAAERRQGR